MTAAELLTDAGFLALCRRWQADGRAPVPGADWLRDRGMDAQADAWEWAANEPNREGHFSSTADQRMGITPAYVRSGSYFWIEGVKVANGLPLGMGYSPWCSSFPEAIAWMLDRYATVHAPAAAAG